MITVSAPAQTTSKMLPLENNSNVQWLHTSANISTDSDSDWEELGYAKPYSDSRLAQRKILWKAASDGAINTAVGRVYKDKDSAMCQRTEKQSEEDLSNDNDSAAYVDFTDDVERMMQPNEIVIPNGNFHRDVFCLLLFSDAVIIIKIILVTTKNSYNCTIFCFYTFGRNLDCLREFTNRHKIMQ